METTVHGVTFQVTPLDPALESTAALAFRSAGYTDRVYGTRMCSAREASASLVRATGPAEAVVFNSQRAKLNENFSKIIMSIDAAIARQTLLSITIDGTTYLVGHSKPRDIENLAFYLFQEQPADATVVDSVDELPF